MSEEENKEESGKSSKNVESEISVEDKDNYRKKLFSIIRHVHNVDEAACLLVEQLISTATEREDMEFARRLYQRVRKHDLSKFEGIEWEFLHRGEENEKLLKIAINQHQQSNDHHPQYFVGGISQMSDLQLAEMVCDWYARSKEMGTGLREYIKEKATARFGFSTRTKIYQKIKKFVDLLLDEQFS